MMFGYDTFRMTETQRKKFVCLWNAHNRWPHKIELSDADRLLKEHYKLIADGVVHVHVPWPKMAVMKQGPRPQFTIDLNRDEQ